MIAALHPHLNWGTALYPQRNVPILNTSCEYLSDYLRGKYNLYYVYLDVAICYLLSFESRMQLFYV